MWFTWFSTGTYVTVFGVCGLRGSVQEHTSQFCGVCGLHGSVQEHMSQFCGVCGLHVSVQEHMSQFCGVCGLVQGQITVLWLM